MSQILAIDPGTKESAYVLFDGECVGDFGKESNERMRWIIRDSPTFVVVEQIEGYGMPVGKEVFTTVMWTGRFIELADAFELVPRRTVKLTLCKSPKANDAAIRQRLIDMFGGKGAAVGKKKTPGPLYGIHGDVWAALALAVTWFEMKKTKEL